MDRATGLRSPSIRASSLSRRRPSPPRNGMRCGPSISGTSASRFGFTMAARRCRRTRSTRPARTPSDATRWFSTAAIRTPSAWAARPPRPDCGRSNERFARTHPDSRSAADRPVSAGGRLRLGLRLHAAHRDPRIRSAWIENRTAVHPGLGTAPVPRRARPSLLQRVRPTEGAFHAGAGPLCDVRLQLLWAERPRNLQRPLRESEHHIQPDDRDAHVGPRRHAAGGPDSDARSPLLPSRRPLPLRPVATAARARATDANADPAPGHPAAHAARWKLCACAGRALQSTLHARRREQPRPHENSLPAARRDLGRDFAIHRLGLRRRAVHARQRRRRVHQVGERGEPLPGADIVRDLSRPVERAHPAMGGLCDAVGVRCDRPFYARGVRRRVRDGAAVSDAAHHPHLLEKIQGLVLPVGQRERDLRQGLRFLRRQRRAAFLRRRGAAAAACTDQGQHDGRLWLRAVDDHVGHDFERLDLSASGQGGLLRSAHAGPRRHRGRARRRRFLRGHRHRGRGTARSLFRRSDAADSRRATGAGPQGQPGISRHPGQRSRRRVGFLWHRSSAVGRDACGRDLGRWHRVRPSAPHRCAGLATVRRRRPQDDPAARRGYRRVGLGRARPAADGRTAWAIACGSR